MTSSVSPPELMVPEEFDWRKSAQERYDRARAAAEERSAAFYAANEPTKVLDIDWPYPPCPICHLDLEHTGDGWWCDVCCIAWEESGCRGERDMFVVEDRAHAPD